MRIHTNPDALPGFKNAVITIGTFDGVHTGHQKIIAQLKSEAAIINGETVIITFDPHPRMIIKAASQPVAVLNTLQEKIELLSALQIDHLVIVPFTAAFAAQTPEIYISKFLVEQFNPRTVIIGYDHRFGNKRAGDYHMLEAYAKQYNYIVKEIPEHVLQETTISSTRIREALSKGDINTANEFLGYPYFFEGVIVKGNQLGRTLGYPTANIQPSEDNKLIPANGVYAITASIKERPGSRLAGMMNIGVRPTINGTHRVIEVNLFDFAEDIYGCNLRVNIKHRLRNEEKFNGLDALKEQLAKDKEHALEKLFSKS